MKTRGVAKGNSNAWTQNAFFCPFWSGCVGADKNRGQRAGANGRPSVFLSVLTHFRPKFGPGLRRRGHAPDVRTASTPSPLTRSSLGEESLYPPHRSRRHLHPLVVAAGISS